MGWKYVEQMAQSIKSQTWKIQSFLLPKMFWHHPRKEIKKYKKFQL